MFGFQQTFLERNFTGPYYKIRASTICTDNQRVCSHFQSNRFFLMFSSIRKWLMFFRPTIRVTFHRFLLYLAFHSDSFHRLFHEWFPVSRSHCVHLYSIAVTVQTLFLIVSQLPSPSICIAHFCTRNHPRALCRHRVSMALSRCIVLCTVLGNVRPEHVPSSPSRVCNE